MFGTILFLGVSGSVLAEDRGINIKNRKPLETVQDMSALRTYATSNEYYFTVNLRHGMKISYSASYGIGGEAAQAEGVIVEKDGKFLFQQHSNPSSNLLLPPGVPFNSSSRTSLWDIGAYLEMVNRVALMGNGIRGNSLYNEPEAALVDFEAGTAGNTVRYRNALEASFTKTLDNRSTSNLKVYFARGIGPVVLEFRETSSPGGTFKFYLGE